MDAIPCSWGPETIDYTTAQNFKRVKVSSGTSSALGVQTEGLNLETKTGILLLKGDVINEERVRGTNICLLISGGPTTGRAAFSNVPTLRLMIRTNPPPETKATSVEEVEELGELDSAGSFSDKGSVL